MLKTRQPNLHLPHGAVLNEQRLAAKHRVVFDASSKATGCLASNDCLMTGPNLNPELLSVLLNFRQHRVALMADIEKAFFFYSRARQGFIEISLY